jgi:hypothetical protein
LDGLQKNEGGKIMRRPAARKTEIRANGKGSGHVLLFDFNAGFCLSGGREWPVGIGKWKARAFHNEKESGLAE